MIAPAAVEPVVFSCEGSSLVGVLHHGAGSAREVAVLVVVGGPQYRAGSHRQFVSTARALAADGWPVLRFDYRGMGDSEGEYAGFEHVAADIRSAINVLQVECRPRRGVVLLGLCDAASAALMYCCSDHRVAGLILMNPWMRSEQLQAEVMVKRYYSRRLMQADFWRKLLSGGFEFRGSLRSFFGSLARATRRPPASGAVEFIKTMCSGLCAFPGRVLIVQSGRDLTADEFRTRCRTDAGWQRAVTREGVELIDMAGADHTFSRMADLEAFNGYCRDWLGRSFGRTPCR